jgi:formylglycine-generating enzyme
MTTRTLIVLALVLAVTAGATLVFQVADTSESIANTGLTAPEGMQLEGMVFVAGGTYVPIYAAGKEEDRTEVLPYFLDEVPVTNADYLRFVKENPRWQRSRVPRVFADERYLRHWNDDLSFDADLANRPVVNIPWFAAQAYAKWAGKRLPTTAEWEFAAAASETHVNGAEDPSYRGRIVEWYSRPQRGGPAEVRSVYQNVYGAWDLHGLVWEWVDDYNEALVTGDSRDNVDMDLKAFCGSGAVNATDATDYAGFIRFAFRSGLEASYTVGSLGFRLAQDVPTSIEVN